MQLYTLHIGWLYLRNWLFVNPQNSLTFPFQNANKSKCRAKRIYVLLGDRCLAWYPYGWRVSVMRGTDMLRAHTYISNSPPCFVACVHARVCIGAPIQYTHTNSYKYIYGPILHRCPDEDLACFLRHIYVHLSLQLYTPRRVACVQSIVM